MKSFSGVKNEKTQKIYDELTDRIAKKREEINKFELRTTSAISSEALTLIGKYVTKSKFIRNIQDLYDSVLRYRQLYILKLFSYIYLPTKDDLDFFTMCYLKKLPLISLNNNFIRDTNTFMYIYEELLDSQFMVKNLYNKFEILYTPDNKDNKITYTNSSTKIMMAKQYTLTIEYSNFKDPDFIRKETELKTAINKEYQSELDSFIGLTIKDLSSINYVQFMDVVSYAKLSMYDINQQQKFYREFVQSNLSGGKQTRKKKNKK